MNLSAIKPRIVIRECSPVHAENVLTDVLEKAKLGEHLAKMVLTLNPKSGELGEGMCNNMQEIAKQIMEGLD